MERQGEVDLSGKVAIVTGASRGIGKRAAVTFARRGVKVVVASRTVDPDSKRPGTVGETVSEIECSGGEALAVATDLADEEALKNLVDAAIDRFGGVDILINNAAVTDGRSWSAPIEDMPRSDWLYHFAVNLHAPFTLIQLVLPSMEKRGGGRIMNVTTASAEASRLPEEPSFVGSLAETMGQSDAPRKDLNLESLGYFSSKRALDRFSNVIAPQLHRKNIFIVNLHPGHVATELVVERHKADGLAVSTIISMDIPARMLAYFAACENPTEYTGRIFIADRDIEELGLELDKV
jgi:NAD(P)-dependent dehydrogenase (short-subunit alcohol dehydrogenase family)